MTDKQEHSISHSGTEAGREASGYKRSREFRQYIKNAKTAITLHTRVQIPIPPPHLL